MFHKFPCFEERQVCGNLVNLSFFSLGWDLDLCGFVPLAFVMQISISILFSLTWLGKELLFLAAESVRGEWGRTWKGGREGRYPANDNYDANMVRLLLSGKFTSENLQKFIRIFDVNSQRYVNPQHYAENKEEYDTEIQKGNAFLDQFANSVYPPYYQAEETEKNTDLAYYLVRMCISLIYTTSLKSN